MNIVWNKLNRNATQEAFSVAGFEANKRNVTVAHTSMTLTLSFIAHLRLSSRISN